MLRYATPKHHDRSPRRFEWKKGDGGVHLAGEAENDEDQEGVRDQVR